MGGHLLISVHTYIHLTRETIFNVPELWNQVLLLFLRPGTWKAIYQPCAKHFKSASSTVNLFLELRCACCAVQLKPWMNASKISDQWFLFALELSLLPKKNCSELSVLANQLLDMRAKARRLWLAVVCHSHRHQLVNWFALFFCTPSVLNY